MSAKVYTDMAAIKKRMEAAKKFVNYAATEAIIEYGNIFVREDTGELKDSALIASNREEGKAIWDTPYAKRMYYTGKPARDKNPNASLMWADKGVNTYRKELDKVVQNAFNKGFES